MGEWSKCKWCGEKTTKENLRDDACFKCVEIESIIWEGTDMYDKYVVNTKKEKIDLINKLYPKECAEYWYRFHVTRLEKFNKNSIYLRRIKLAEIKQKLNEN